MFGNSAPFSYAPRGFSPENPPHQRRTFQQDEPKTSPLQRNGLSRPSGKFIYMQRKEYSETLNRQPENLHIRVEHLFTCELDGQEIHKLDDCLAKLKMLHTKGRIWPQEMIMEVQGGYLLLSDIESKIELESLSLSSIVQTKSILDSCAYNSLLTITVQERSKRFPQVYMFQCEETGADTLKSDLDKVIQKRGGDVEPRRDQSDIRSNLENIITQHSPGGFQQAGPRAVQREMIVPPPDHPSPTHWGNREPERMPSPRGYTPMEETRHHPDLRELQSSPELILMQTEAQRNTDILNHVIGDVEIFIMKVSAAVNPPPPQEEKSKKKKKKKGKSKKNAAADTLPPWAEYTSCLQKIKYGFNLLGQLDGILNKPTAPDFVHIFFSCLGSMVPQYPADLPPTVITPLLTEAALRLLCEVITPEEEHLWTSLGNPWKTPISRWPNNNVSPYIPDFYDGWQPPSPSRNPPMSRSNSRGVTPDRPNRQPMSNSGFSSPARNASPTSFSEPPLYMRVIYNFMARNNQELSVMKGDMVEVIQKSKQWWLVRNARGEEGSIPQNVLQPVRNNRSMVEDMQESRSSVTLDMLSKSAEVRAWLQYKGFSKLTVSSLGVLTGKLLLGMSKDEIRTVCPEEGGKVFFQLQAVKSAIALASEPSGQYNGRY